ncbi:MAG: hypothetical protein FWE95_00355 [Planctomycetaceae bacterium]|nr:hypothetical protein [Planctomycetaceae bacterium]
MKKLSRALFAVLFLGIAGSAWAEELNDRLSESNQAIVREREQKIKEEIAQLKDHPWAGQYYYGYAGGAGAFLTLAPNNGFTIIGYDHGNLTYLEHGMVDWDGTYIKLSYTFDLKGGSIDDEAVKRKPIRWGERVYLIPTYRIIEFCNEINSGWEPRNYRSGRFYLRQDDWEKEAPGKPELPEELMPYLLDEPVEATIVSVKKTWEANRDWNIATVVVDKGKNDGFLPGMELYVVKPVVSGTKVKLTKVEETQSVGELNYSRPRDDSLFSRLFGTPAPAKGWQLSTSWKR